MGIRGLTSFVDDIQSVWSIEGDLRDRRVIVDGCALIFYLHGSIDSRYGGQYDRFSNKIQHFFDCFKARNVEAYVVLDGPTVAVDKKLDTLIKRARDNVQRCDKISRGVSAEGIVAPPLAKRAFVQKLRQMEIPFAVCDREADQEIASLAHQWECPVISNDSDFFINDLPAGYIPLSHLHYNKLLIHAKVYKRERLSAHLEVHQCLMPLFASLLGNDFVDHDVLAPFERELKHIQPSEYGQTTRKAAKIRSICCFLANSSDVAKALESVLDIVENESEKTSLENALVESLAEYDISDGALASYFELGEIHSSLSDVSKYVIERHRTGDFPSRYLGVISCARHILEFQIEDVRQKTANRCSRKLRQIIYGILSFPEENGRGVMEWMRIGTVVQNQRVEPNHRPVKGFGDLPDLESIEHMKEEQRRKLLLSIFKSDESVQSLPGSKQLFVMSIRYWISHAKPKVTKIHVQTLILQHLYLRTTKKTPLKESSFDIGLQHNLAQWQSVMAETIFLNNILMDAFPEPDFSTLYNGATAQSIMHDLSHSHGKPLDQFISQLDDHHEYQMIYNAATDGLDQKLLDPSPAKGDIKPKRKEKREKSQKQAYSCGSNRFAALQLSDDD